MPNINVVLLQWDEGLTWSVAPDCPSPFCSFLGSFSRMVKIQSSLPKSFPPDAWPSCSLIGQVLKRLWAFIRMGDEVMHVKCLKPIITNVGGKQHWGCFSPAAGCVCVKLTLALFQIGVKELHAEETKRQTSQVRRMVSDLRVRLIRTWLCGSWLFCLPPLVLVHQLSQVGGFFRMADDQLMLQQLFGSRPLWKRRDEHMIRSEETSSVQTHKKNLSIWNATYKTGLFVETGLDKLLERFAVVALQCGRVVLWDEE